MSDDTSDDDKTKTTADSSTSKKAERVGYAAAGAFVGGTLGGGVGGFLLGRPGEMVGRVLGGLAGGQLGFFHPDKAPAASDEDEPSDPPKSTTRPNPRRSDADAIDCVFRDE